MIRRTLLAALAVGLVAQPAMAQSPDFDRNGTVQSRTSLSGPEFAPRGLDVAFGLTTGAPGVANAQVPARWSEGFVLPSSDSYRGQGGPKVLSVVGKQTTEVPEPGMLGLMAAGMIGLLGVGLTRKQDVTA